MQEIVHNNASGVLLIRDHDGEVLSVIDPPGYMSDFSVVEWPSFSEFESIVYARNNQIHVLAFRREPRAELSAPHLQRLAVTKAVVWNSRDRELFAVVAEIRSWDRSMLLLYDESHELIYQELSEERLGAIATLSDGSGHTDLLVGSKNRVTRYHYPDLRVDSEISANH